MIITRLGKMTDMEDDEPAMEIERELSLRISPEMRTHTMRTGRHGPAVSRQNGVVCLTHDARLGRVYIGMQLGQVMFWDLRQSAADVDDKLYRGCSSHKLVGQHLVRPLSGSLCIVPVTPVCVP